MQPLRSITSPLCLSLFGPFEARVGGEPLAPLRSRKGQWLLALLALRHGREVDRSWLMGLLWPDHPPHLAAHSLRNSLTDLRRALGPEVRRLFAPKPRTLALDLTGGAVDVLQFDEALARGDTARLEEAVALYRGPLLEGWTEDWVIPERQSREQAFLGALERLAAAAADAGDQTAAEQYLRRTVAVDPLRESAHRSLMQLLAGLGHTPAALTVYHELRWRLHRDANAVPDAATTALFESLSERSRRNGTRGNLPPPTRPKAAAGNLSLPLTRFIGREAELGAVTALVQTHRLVTMTGAGGCGKTRLALEAARLMQSRAPGGVWFVDLAPVADPALVVSAIAAAVAVREEGGRPLLQTLIGALQSRRLVLLLDNCEPHVAACAELAEALLHACPELQILATSREALGVAGEQLYQVPPLSLPPESVFGVGCPGRSGYRTPNTQFPTPNALLEYDSVRLFVDRATAVHSTFRLSGENAPAVAAVCRGLEGMPLAIELSAARVKLLSVQQIAAGLEDRVGLLTAGSRTAPPRHRTLRASIDWSHELLSEPERILLRRLSVFRGGWSLQAALAVCGDSGSEMVDSRSGADLSAIQNPQSKIQNEPVFDLLGQLVDKSLVVREERRGEARFRLLETIAEYGREKLEIAGELSWMRERHRDCFLALAEEVSNRMWGAEVEPWHDRVELEAENLRSALAWSVGRGEGETALQLGAGLAPFWGRRHMLSEGREQLDRLLRLSEVSPPTSERAWVLKAAGLFARALGHHAEARRQFKASLEIYQRLGDEAAVSAVLADLAELALYREGNAAAGRAYLEEQMSCCHGLGDPLATAAALVGQSNLAHLAADYRRARELSEAVLRLRKAADRPEAVEKTLEGLGYLVYDLGDHTTALALFEERLTAVRARAKAQGGIFPPRPAGHQAAELRPGRTIRALSEEYVQVYQGIADRRRLAGSLISLGSLVFEQGDFAGAQAFWEESLDLFRQGGDRANTALALSHLAEAARCRGEHDAAGARLEECRRIGEEIQQRRTLADAIYRQGLLASDLGEWEAAEKHLEESRVHYQELGHRWPLLLALCHQSTLARRQGDLARARGLLGEALPCLRETEHQPGIALALAVRGYVLRDEGDLSQACADLLESLAMRQPRADRLGIALCLEGLASIDAATKQHRHAARLLGAAAALRDAIGAPLPPADRDGYDCYLTTLCAALDREAFAAAWTEGQAMPEAAATEALKAWEEGQR